jgi:hypothetical protein
VMKKQQSIIVGLSTDYVDLDSGVLPTYRCISESTSPALEYCQLTGISLNSLPSVLEKAFQRSSGAIIVHLSSTNDRRTCPF